MSNDLLSHWQSLVRPRLSQMTPTVCLNHAHISLPLLFISLDLRNVKTFGIYISVTWWYFVMTWQIHSVIPRRCITQATVSHFNIYIFYHDLHSRFAKSPTRVCVCVSPFLIKFVILILGYFCFTLLMLQKHTVISTICMGGLAGGWKWGLRTGRHTLFMTEPLNMLYLHRFKCQHAHDSFGHSRLVREWKGGGPGVMVRICVCVCVLWHLGAHFFPRWTHTLLLCMESA